MIREILIAFVSFFAGFCLCALFASGKIAELGEQIWDLRRQLEE